MTGETDRFDHGGEKLRHVITVCAILLLTTVTRVLVTRTEIAERDARITESRFKLISFQTIAHPRRNTTMKIETYLSEIRFNEQRCVISANVYPSSIYALIKLQVISR